MRVIKFPLHTVSWIFFLALLYSSSRHSCKSRKNRPQLLSSPADYAWCERFHALRGEVITSIWSIVYITKGIARDTYRGTGGGQVPLLETKPLGKSILKQATSEHSSLLPSWIPRHGETNFVYTWCCMQTTAPNPLNLSRLTKYLQYSKPRVNTKFITAISLPN